MTVRAMGKSTDAEEEYRQWLSLRTELDACKADQIHPHLVELAIPQQGQNRLPLAPHN
jgi:hypothetical protein